MLTLSFLSPSHLAHTLLVPSSSRYEPLRSPPITLYKPPLPACFHLPANTH